MSRSLPSRPLPQRTCVACGAKKAQAELLRVVSQAGATPFIDEKGRAPGRGAYVCRAAACVEKAFARRAFERALKLQKPAHAALQQLKTQILATVADGASPMKTGETGTSRDEPGAGQTENGASQNANGASQQ